MFTHLINLFNMVKANHMVGWFRAHTVVFDTSNIRRAGLNFLRGMIMSQRFSLLCCSLNVEAFAWAEPSSKKSYQISTDLQFEN
jgi:hypothetical protein